ncbi:peroxiredoxin family protein [Halorussus halophilus]|uniref:peroxiredoxin family protein n=1 Tax=Halorussus halophilus TaxID=2650975 RepID=UPI0013011E65|nr:redoxin domain-containing protein [Halorussus halophilus]
MSGRSGGRGTTGGWELGVTETDFELPNAGTGPDPLRLSEFATDHDAVVLFFQRDYRSGDCKEQAQTLADRYGEFRDRDTVVVSVLPESEKRANKWQKKLHLPFPLVADEDKAVAEQYGQPTRWGKLGSLHDLLGRLPEVAILDARDGLQLWSIHRGEKPDDRPTVDEVLQRLDTLLGDDRGL